MRKQTAALMILLAMLLAVPWSSEAGHGHNGHTRVFIGGSFWCGPPAYWGPAPWGPRYYYHGAPVYYGPPPMYVPPPQVYVQREPTDSDYWYYCDNPQGFYPYIRSCPGGWMKVIPENVPPVR